MVDLWRSEARCAGSDAFTADGIDRGQARTLVNICRECPVLDACTEDLNRYRRKRADEFYYFRGVWAGVHWVHGRPRE